MGMGSSWPLPGLLGWGAQVCRIYIDGQVDGEGMKVHYE